MLTLDALKAYGANVDEGMARCFNNEAFYLKLVGMGLADANFDRLASGISSGDAREAFEAAHALKGSIGNLAITPIYQPVCALTELLRGKDGIAPECAALADQVADAHRRAKALMD